MTLLLSALVICAAVVWGSLRISTALGARQPDVRRARAVELMAMFAPALAGAAADPRAILVWEPLARMGRQIFPDEFALLDQAAGGVFPFSHDRVQSAHAQWTADWLAWERTHDAEYKLKAAAVEEEIAAAGTSTVLRARLDAVESEKLGRYQQRYQEYVRVAKALQAITAVSPSAPRAQGTSTS
jgi:heme A synthase